MIAEARDHLSTVRAMMDRIYNKVGVVLLTADRMRKNNFELSDELLGGLELMAREGHDYHCLGRMLYDNLNQAHRLMLRARMPSTHV
jgi:hypothetical protein